MKTNTKEKRTFLFYPILFGVYPVLALYAFNRNEIVVTAIQQAVITSIIVTIVVIGLSLLVFRSWQKAAAHATLTLLLFYTYGHVYDFAQNITVFGKVLGRDRFLIPIWILLFVIGQILLLRSQKTTLNRVLNTVSLFLMIFVAVQILVPLVQFSGSKTNSPDELVSAQTNPSSTLVDRDVYYIVVDAYSRQDLLQKEIGLDISGFISELESLGFYIPACAQSNYDNTLPSMTTSLNMNYLDALHLDYFGDKAKYESYIKKNLVMESFKKMGYSTATFPSLHPMLDLPDSTYYYDYFEDTSTLKSLASLNFQYLFLKTTLVRPLVAFIERNQEIRVPAYLATWLPTGNTLDSREYRQYQQNIFAFDSLQKIPNLAGKTFTYAHLYITHQPFVFYPDGSFHPFLMQDIYGYRDQVIYANTRLLEIVETILATSDPQPIIVIQSDHSFFENADRVKILNAYYLPDGGTENLYPTITPINTFRMIFNTYFGGQYELLPDVSRYSENKVVYETPSTCVGTTSTEK
ncbi:MAG TPA: hypothetical protein VFQ13_24290 [Anaerolineales bacterium]|nr:hypothetical protein [Anaerolineales bacterium]